MSDELDPTSGHTSRRAFLCTWTGTLAGAGLMAGSPLSRGAARTGRSAIGTLAAATARRTRNRVGAVAYGYQYSLGLFSYKDRPGEKFGAVKFVEGLRGRVAKWLSCTIR